MIQFIILFGFITFVAGVIILIKPEIIFGFLRRHIDKPVMQILGVVLRLVLGAFLILESEISRFPALMEILGWISIGAAIILGIMGRRIFLSLMNWALSLSTTLSRVGGVVAMSFGAFLVYAFV